jgi:hypothetical protein
MAVRDLRAVEELRSRIARSVVGEDDLRREIAVVKERGAPREARLDAASLVEGR